MQFIDRKQAGQALAQKLLRYRDNPDVVVLGLPRGGVPVAFEVAQAFASSACPGTRNSRWARSRPAASW